MRWWADRLTEHCRDDIAGGLFTDQRWADHIPAMFDGVRILREPVYNVATWNLSNRRATGNAPDGLLINGKPLVFYHFSGLDSGAQETMLGLYGQESPELKVLRQWYLQACDQQGQARLGRLPCSYSRYDNGEAIEKAHRLLYRDRLDVQKAFPNPFSTSDVNQSYYHWFKANVEAAPENARSPSLINQELQELRRELGAIKRSRSWKWAQRFSSWARALRA